MQFPIGLRHGLAFHQPRIIKGAFHGHDVNSQLRRNLTSVPARILLSKSGTSPRIPNGKRKMQLDRKAERQGFARGLGVRLYAEATFNQKSN